MSKGSEYLALVEADDAWVDSGTGNMAWKAPKRAKTAIQRVPNKRIREMIADNCALIKTIDSDMIPLVEERVFRLINNRMDVDDFIDWCQEECNIEEWQAMRIATDQVQKVLNQIKIEDWKRRGMEYVVWLHDGPEDPRDYHKRKWDGRSGLKTGRPNGLNGFVFRLSDPPVIDKKTGQRGIPGQLIGCRCYLKAISGIK